MKNSIRLFLAVRLLHIVSIRRRHIVSIKGGKAATVTKIASFRNLAYSKTREGNSEKKPKRNQKLHSQRNRKVSITTMRVLD